MATNELIVVEALTPAIVFAEGGVDDVLYKLRSKVTAAATDLDISTEKGRKQIASLAFQVARSKTALDEMGKDLVAGLKERTGKIDAERKRLRDKIDELKDEIRKPLTDWENADEKRCSEHEAAIADIERTASFGVLAPSSAEISGRIAYLKELAVSDRDWQEFRERARKSALAAHGELVQMLEAAQKREAQEAEQERLHKEAAEKAQRERDEKIAREAEDKAKREAEAVAAREADKKHRTAVNRSAVEAFVKGGIPEETAKQVVTLIVMHAVPHISIAY